MPVDLVGHNKASLKSNVFIQNWFSKLTMVRHLLGTIVVKLCPLLKVSPRSRTLVNPQGFAQQIHMLTSDIFDG